MLIIFLCGNFIRANEQIATYTAPVLEGRLFGTVTKSSPVTRIVLSGPSSNSSHLQLDGHPRKQVDFSRVLDQILANVGLIYSYNNQTDDLRLIPSQELTLEEMPN